MSAKDKLKDQVTVKLDPKLKAAVQRAALAEHRTVSQQIRHFVACMVEAQQPPTAA